MRSISCVLAAVLVAAALPATAGAIRFRLAVTYELTEPWQATSPYGCDVVGSGNETIRFQVHRVVQIYGDQRRPNDPHPTTVAYFGTPDVVTRSAQLSVNPPDTPDGSCDPPPPVACGTKSASGEGGGFEVFDATRRIRIGTGIAGRGPLEKADDAFDRSGTCPGPGAETGWMKERVPLAWPGWKRIFRPGGRASFVIDHRFGPQREDWSGFNRVDVSGQVHATISLRNICRTLRATPALRRLERGLVTHGRVCASGQA